MLNVGEQCIYCDESVAWGSGLYVNRIPADDGERMGFMCAICLDDAEKLAEDCRPTYPDQNTGDHYTERQLLSARRKSDHPEEPSWGIYEVNGAMAVFADCDVAHVEGIQCN